MRSFSALLSLFLLLANLPSGIVNSIPVWDEAGLEPASGSVVCVPGIYNVAPDDCVPLGPSEELTQAASEGIPYPVQPLPAYSPDPVLVDIPFHYFQLNQDGKVFYLFPTLDDAMASSVSSLALGPGEVIVSYVDRVENEGGVFYRLRSGAWVRGDFGGRLAMHKPFQGLLFSSMPRHSFGWVLEPVKSVQAPSFNAHETGNTYYRYNIVQVYATQEAEGITWLMIGPDEWLDYRQVGRVDPRSTPPEGITTSRWIEVNLDEQTLAVYQDNRLVFATLTSTGIDTLWTRPGIFQVYEKKDAETMSGSTTADRSDFYYIEDVPWTMYFDEKRALHGAFWHDRFGYQNSHGCVNLPVGDAHWLYNWANVGDYVYVYDPSGRTPTDPSLYGSGAP
jgi:L,D-transpeptidase catalytic domain